MESGALSPLFAYPAAARFDRVMPKNKIFAHAKPPRRLQKRFADEVAQIVWSYKLSPDTIRLPARNGVDEVQVFTITLKPGAASADPDASPPEDLLRCIDKAVPSPLIFEVATDARVRVVAAYKRQSDADPSKWVLGEYHASPSLPLNAPRSPLPVALDLAALYAAIIRTLLPLPARPGEPLRDHADRAAAAKTLERECRTLEARLAREPQFNRKVELNAQARALRQQLDQLLQPQAPQD
jgi:hypothetical protein